MKVLGYILLGIGGIIDFIQMIMLLFEDMDYQLFNVYTIVGTILFFVGLGLISVSGGSRKV